MPASAIKLQISEADFLKAVIDLAKLRGWLVHHQRPARTKDGWRTAIQGHPGFPDLALARDGEVLVWELKRHGAHPTPGQKDWLRALGANGQLLRPDDWLEICEALR